MGYERFIGNRYLKSKRQSRMVSIITVIAVLGVAVGVTAMIVVLSVMGGFKKDLKEKILGTKAHIIVQRPGTDRISKSEHLLEKIRNTDGVVGASPFVRTDVMVSSPTNLNGVALHGVDPSTIGQVSQLPSNLREGKLRYLEDSRPLVNRLEEQRQKDIQGLIHELESERAEQGGTDGSDGDASPSTESDLGASLPKQAKPNGDSESTASDSNPSKPDKMAPMPGRESESSDSETNKMRPMLDPNNDSENQGLPGIILGAELIKSLQVDLGSEVNVVTPQGQLGPTGRMPSSRPFVVVGIFYSGMYEYDANFAYTSLEHANLLTNREGVSGIEVRTSDVEKAFSVADRLQDKLGARYDVKDWKELNKSLFFALQLEKWAMFVVLVFIILVASFSIVAMLIMTVIEKSEEIAALKAMGMTNTGVMRIFVYQGTVIGIVGAILGLGLGLGGCFFLQTVGIPLNTEVYYISKLPVQVDRWEVISVLGCAILISCAATIYPAYLAGKLNPVEGLRDE